MSKARSASGCSISTHTGAVLIPNQRCTFAGDASYRAARVVMVFAVNRSDACDDLIAAAIRGTASPKGV